jgi:DNA methylase
MLPESPAYTALNGICPYFTMFPLRFPLRILWERAAPGEWVLDPFCGRGTTNYAARLLGLPSLGIDSSPVAVALAEAKLANTTAAEIVQAAQEVLARVPAPREVPAGEFWQWAFHPEVLSALCRLRQGLREDCGSDARKGLRAVLLGALHGPLNKTRRTYLSNQCPRTFAPKPAYSVRFWQRRGLRPPLVDVLQVVEERAARYYDAERSVGQGAVVPGDSRSVDVAAHLPEASSVGWVITSPPYYGMRSYLPDQWLRSWFLGGPPEVRYSMDGQLRHTSPQTFSDQLSQVWRQAGKACRPGARLVVRYGGIHDRKAAPMVILLSSLHGSGWRVQTHVGAGSAAAGRRQSLHFAREQRRAMEERDVWAIWEG